MWTSSKLHTWLPEAVASVRSLEIQLGSDRYDAGGIQLRVALVVVMSDVIQMYRAPDGGHLVQIACVRGERRVVCQATQVAFEVAVVGSVKTNQRDEQPYVSLGEAISAQVALRREASL